MMNSRLWVMMIGLLCCLVPVPAAAERCRIDRDEGAALFKVHLSGDCTDQERQGQAVQAARLQTALKEGKVVDLSGVVIEGDVWLDRLPLGPVSKELEQRWSGSVGAVRAVAGAVSIVNSLVKGTVRHESATDFLVMAGPVTLAGTTFEQSVDLSQVVFAEPVILSGAVFLRESLFVNGRFLRDLFAEKTAFGPHARFHRSQFHGPVTFQQSGFNGLAEFLEVEFEKDADFSRTYFKLGTGFSGSHFHGLADFSEAQFDREAFFTFARFDGDAYFRRATFRSMADFDDAQFHGRDDFSKVMFESESRFTRVMRPANGPSPLGLENLQVQYGITLSLLIFSVLLIAYLIRSR